MKLDLAEIAGQSLNKMEIFCTFRAVSDKDRIKRG